MPPPPPPQAGDLCGERHTAEDGAHVLLRLQCVLRGRHHAPRVVRQVSPHVTAVGDVVGSGRMSLRMRTEPDSSTSRVAAQFSRQLPTTDCPLPPCHCCTSGARRQSPAAIIRIPPPRNCGAHSYHAAMGNNRRQFVFVEDEEPMTQSCLAPFVSTASGDAVPVPVSSYTGGCAHATYFGICCHLFLGSPAG